MGRWKNLFGGVNIGKRFRLHHSLGAGTMSKVWRATDTKSGREVCLKILDKEQLALLMKRFVGVKRPSEGEIALGMEHPNIVKTYEHGLTTKGEQFVVMEYVRGTGLILLAEMRSPELRGRELDYLIQAGDALSYVHDKGFIHRDVCPHNVIITPEKVATLIDFGLSVPNTPDFCKPGNRTGKVSYMAPELIKRSTTDVRVDVFAFGVSAYQVFTGQLPWDAAQSLESMLQHINRPPRDPREFLPEFDDKTAAVLLKAISRNRNDRFASISAFVTALRELRDSGC